MTKNMFSMKQCKRALSVVLTTVLMVTLSGCASTADKNPTGGLDTDAVYAKSSNFTLTQGALYTELKHNSLSYLTNQIELATFNDYLPKVVYDDKQEELLAEYMLEAIYGTSDEDDIADQSKKDRELAVTKYIDFMYTNGITVTKAQLETAINVETMKGSDAFKNNDVREYYKINIAKYLYAVDCLEKEIEEKNKEAEKDDEVSPYFTDQDIANYYDNNYKYDYDEDINAVIIRFMNQNEANNVLRKFGIKTYNGEWFLIQPPKDEHGNTDFSKWENEADYNKYYDDYVINQSAADSADTTIAAASGSRATILKLYVEMYNYIYTYRSTLTYTNNKVDMPIDSPNYRLYYDLTTKIINADNALSNEAKEKDYKDLVTELSRSEYLTFDKEKLDTYSTSLTTYVNDTLRTEAEIDDETGEVLEFTQYTSSARSYNNFYYLIFKLSDGEDKEFYTIEEDEDDEEYYDFKLENAEMKKIYDEILDELFDEKLTSSYIDARATEKAEFISVSIYDTTIEFYYSQQNSDYKATKKSSDNLVALIKYNDKDTKTTWEIEITVKQTYDALEKLNGPQTAVALLFNDYIVTTDYYKDSDNDEDYETYKEGINFTLANFANDAYSSYGYPASIGKYAFMQAYYRTAIIDEAIEYLRLQDAKREFFLENTTTSDFYDEMQEYADLAYTNYYSLTLTNIYVYVDMDEDGEADKDWFTTESTGNQKDEYNLTPEQKVEKAHDLIKEIIAYAKADTNALATSFTNVVEEYNSSSRIEVAGDAELSGNVEATWAKYRKHGLYISTSPLDEFNNTTDKDKDLQDLVKKVYENEDLEVMMNNSFTGAHLLTNEEDFIIDEKGVNLLLVTAGTGKTEVDADGEESDLYAKVPIRIEDSYEIFDLRSEEGNKSATRAQVEVYCREYFNTGSSTSLPATASSYLSTYLNPILTKYNSEVVQLMIMQKTLATFTNTPSDFDSRLNDYISYSQRVSDNYTDTTSENSTSNFKDFWTNQVLIRGGIN